jgi:DNA-binding XRE family transcriptional regulator
MTSDFLQRFNRKSTTIKGGYSMAIEKITLPAARKNANMTQKELGNKVGVSESTVANWENGKTEPTVFQAYKVAGVLGMDLDDIIFLPKVTVKP